MTRRGRADVADRHVARDKSPPWVLLSSDNGERARRRAADSRVAAVDSEKAVPVALVVAESLRVGGETDPWSTGRELPNALHASAENP
jgi:hypothetical protein